MGKIFDIKKMALHDGPGIRTTVFFTGCPLNCAWCHNPECNIPGHEKIREVNEQEVLREILADEIFYDESGGGVTFSGGEPMIQPIFLRNLLIGCKRSEIHTIIDTSGFFKEQFIDDVLPYTDLFLFDLKLIDDKLHKKYTGQSNKVIFENLKILIEKNANLRLRLAIIPGITDIKENLDQISEFIKTLNRPFPLDLLPYNMFTASKYHRNKLNFQIDNEMEVTGEYLEKIARGFRLSGIDVHY